MTPNNLELYRTYEIDDGHTFGIRQFAGINEDTDNGVSNVFIPWVVDADPRLNRLRTSYLLLDELYQVREYDRS